MQSVPTERDWVYSGRSPCPLLQTSALSSGYDYIEPSQMLAVGSSGNMISSTLRQILMVHLHVQICEAFSANRYPFPEEPSRQRQMNAEVTARLRELQTTIEAGDAPLLSITSHVLHTSQCEPRSSDHLGSVACVFISQPQGRHLSLRGHRKPLNVSRRYTACAVSQPDHLSMLSRSAA